MYRRRYKMRLNKKYTNNFKIEEEIKELSQQSSASDNTHSQKKYTYSVEQHYVGQVSDHPRAPRSPR
jgi:hypothetical protein